MGTTAASTGVNCSRVLELNYMDWNRTRYSGKATGGVGNIKDSRSLCVDLFFSNVESSLGVGIRMVTWTGICGEISVSSLGCHQGGGPS